ncbi:MAG: UDP-N-acetylglucosamine 1-carboxyvinyltransferase [Deltaproteobacteria bacterium]|nr:UDP-N-acetylglucosamine 1-carboxyvinyltransferase [Deltaproteobacteria bacterium]PWB63545.1 MAG: UDP-N-acetylglucosamine 1-carboxyvinyltransferase [Deltaproteobacteria bacterium]
MDIFVIQGGSPLSGTVRVSGAKNAALPLMAASLLAEGPMEIVGAPRLRDISTFGKVLRHMGASVERLDAGGDGRETVRIDPRTVGKAEAPYELVKTMRASVLVLGPLVARHGRARISLPGGCAIGARPIDQHLKGLELMGAKTSLVEGYVEVDAGRLSGATIYFDMKTVTGTENLMMAATLARGTTVLKNAAREPEVCDLARALRAMGADIEGEGTDEIAVRGTDSLRGTRHEVMPDRIEASTLLLAGAITGGDVTVRGADPFAMDAVLTKLAESGAEVFADPGSVRVRREGPIRSLNLETSPYPGFPTDVQAQFMAYLCLGDGFSIVRETIFENRFMHVAELRRMGARIEVSGNAAAVKGVQALSGAPLMATDLRASASLVLAGLAANGTTEVLRIYHLDRGYEALENKLARLGARISRVKE